MSSQTPDRNLALELVRVTEAAALAASRWVGRGDKNAADGAAVDAMRMTMASIAMDGVVVIGEGEKDEAPMLYNGESIGDGSQPAVDIAVDPLEGTTLTAKGQPNALCVVALSLAYPLRTYLGQRADLAAAVSQQRALEQQVADLQANQAALSDPNYIREQAKRRLQYVTPGDTVYVVQAPVTAAASASAAAAAPSGAWYTTLWGTLTFGSEPPAATVDPAAVTPDPTAGSTTVTRSPASPAATSSVSAIPTP